MRCPHCDAANRPDARFCRKCGQTLTHPASEEPGPSEGVPTACPQCGAEVRAAASFCPQCGEPLVPPAAPRDPPPRPPTPDELSTVPKAVPRSSTPSQPSPRRGGVRVLWLVLVGMLVLLFLGGVTLVVLTLLDPEESAAEVIPAPTVTGEGESLPSPEESSAPRPDFAVGIDLVLPEAAPRVGERVTVRVTLFNEGAVPITPRDYQWLKSWEGFLTPLPPEEEESAWPTIAPGQESTQEFTFETARTGEATLQVAVILDLASEPPSTEQVLSSTRSLTILPSEQ